MYIDGLSFDCSNENGSIDIAHTIYAYLDFGEVYGILMETNTTNAELWLLMLRQRDLSLYHNLVNATLPHHERSYDEQLLLVAAGLYLHKFYPVLAAQGVITHDDIFRVYLDLTHITYPSLTVQTMYAFVKTHVRMFKLSQSLMYLVQLNAKVDLNDIICILEDTCIEQRYTIVKSQISLQPDILSSQVDENKSGTFYQYLVYEYPMIALECIDKVGITWFDMNTRFIRYNKDVAFRDLCNLYYNRLGPMPKKVFRLIPESLHELKRLLKVYTKVETPASFDTLTE